MKKELKEASDRFLNNKKFLKNEYKFVSETDYLLGSFLYLDERQDVNIKRLKECNELLKANTKVFSDYRIMDFLLIIKMSLSKDPLKYLLNFKNNYDTITEKKIFASIFRIVSALLVTDAECNNLDKILKREKKIYNAMKDDHPFLTGKEDLPFSTMLALSNRKDSDITKDMEECYNILADKFRNKNEVQTLAQILSMYDETSKKKASKVIEIYDLLLKHNKKVNQNFGLPILGTLLSLDKTTKEVVDSIIEVDNYLGTKKGNGIWPYGKSTRLIFAMLIVESVYGCKSKSSKGTVLISTLVAEEIITSILIMNLIILSD